MHAYESQPIANIYYKEMKLNHETRTASILKFLTE